MPPHGIGGNAMDAVVITGHDSVSTNSKEDGNNPIKLVFTDSQSSKKSEVLITFEELKKVLLNRT